MKKILCFVLSLWCTSLSFANNNTFDSVIVFGDSLSDNGNLYNFLWHTTPASPPYYEGHFSNGIVWAEQLYASLFPSEYNTGFKNYAVGGAGAVLSYKQVLPYTLKMELESYLYWHAYSKKEDTLFTIWIGGNNYLNAPANTDGITDSVVQAINNAIEKLIKAGGNKFLIPNLPDLGKTPYAIEQNQQGVLTHLVKVHNKKLAATIAELQQKYPEVTFVYFDIYTFFGDTLDHAKDYGFSIIDEPCYLGGYSGWLTQATDQELQNHLHSLHPNFANADWSLFANNPQIKEALRAGYIYQLLPQKNKNEALQCEQYVFWDKIHPSTHAHALVANKAKQLIDAAGLTPVVNEETTH